MGNCLYNVLCAYRTFGGVNGIGCYTYFFRGGDRHITLKMVGNLHDNINRTTLQFLHGKVEFISCFNQCQIFGGFDMRHNALRRCRAVQINNRNIDITHIHCSKQRCNEHYSHRKDYHQSGQKRIAKNLRELLL